MGVGHICSMSIKFFTLGVLEAGVGKPALVSRQLIGWLGTDTGGMEGQGLPSGGRVTPGLSCSYHRACLTTSLMTSLVAPSAATPSTSTARTG